MMQGRCSNLPTLCEKAQSAELIDMPTMDTKCPNPKCGAAVLAETGVTKLERGKGPLLLAGAAVAVAAVGAMAFVYPKWPFGLPEKPAAPVMATALKISGSATVGDALAPALVRAFLVSQGGKDIKDSVQTDKQGVRTITVSAMLAGKPVAYSIRTSGNAAGLADLNAGNADLAMTAVPLVADVATAYPALGDLSRPETEHVVAKDASAIIVAPGSPLAGLDVGDLRDIFTGTTSSWQQLGIAGRGPLVVHLRQGSAGTAELAQLLGVADATLSNVNVRRHETAAAVAAAVAADPGGIGVVSQAQAGRALVVAVGADGVRQLLPTTDAIKREAYPLSRRLNFYTGAATKPLANGFIRFVLSDAGQAAVRRAGFVDLTPAVAETSVVEEADCKLESGWNGDPQEYCALLTGRRPVNVTFRFRTGSDALDSLALADVERVAALAKNQPNLNLLLIGFADSRGDYDSNCELSEARAKTVRDALRQRGFDRVATRGFCSALPVRANDADEWEKNRRVEVFAFYR